MQAGEHAVVEALSPSPANSKWGTCKRPAQACNTSQLQHSLSCLGRRKTQFPCAHLPHISPSSQKHLSGP